MEKLQSKVPQIRFPEFKDEWEHKKLSEFLCEAKKRNGDLKYGKDEVLSVSGEMGIVNQIEHLGRSYAGVSVHQYHVVEVGDIVYTKSPLKSNPFGIIKLNKGKAGIVSTLYAVYNVKEKNAYGPFLDYYFSLDANTNRYLRPLVKKGAKNDMKINNAHVLHDRIFVPTTNEQIRIASFLTVLDQKLAQLKQKKTLLEQYKKGIMQKLFSQELRFKDENGNEFPKWEKKKLGDITVSISSGKSKLNESIGNYPLYGSTGIIGYLDTYEYSGNNILIARVGANAGSLYRVSGNYSVTDNTLVLKLSKDVIPDFMFYILTNWNLNKLIFGSGQPLITGGLLKSLKINIPSSNEQTKIANFLSSIDEKINRTENQIQQTGQYKKGLLQNMFV